MKKTGTEQKCDCMTVLGGRPYMNPVKQKCQTVSRQIRCVEYLETMGYKWVENWEPWT